MSRTQVEVCSHGCFCSGRGTGLLAQGCGAGPERQSPWRNQLCLETQPQDPETQGAGQVGTWKGVMHYWESTWGRHVLSWPKSSLEFSQKIDLFKVFIEFVTTLLLFSFNWGIIALQCCVGFCHTTWISHRSTYVPSLWNLPATLLPITPLSEVTEHGLNSLLHSSSH